jgi:hypothetical protein
MTADPMIVCTFRLRRSGHAANVNTESPRPYVTTDDLRRLPDAGDPDGQLLLVAGAVRQDHGHSPTAARGS